MRISDDRIVVDHAGSLPRPDRLLELSRHRIVRFAEDLGRERVIASTDCGLGGRVHPQTAWAKPEALARGADLADPSTVELTA
jgi:methionine synthase II (cobalamin-independent)